MKLRKNNKNWEIDFTKIEIFGTVFLLLMGVGMAVTTIYDVGSTASAIASNMTVAGTLNCSDIINTSSNVWAAAGYFQDVNATDNLNVTFGTVTNLHATTGKITTANVTHATITNPIFTTANGTHATIGTLYGTLVSSTTLTDGTATLTGGVLSALTTLNVTTSNATRSEAVTFTDGTATLTAGALTGVTELNVSDSTIGTLYNTQLNGTHATIGTLYGTLGTLTTLTDGTATLTAGDLTGVDDMNVTDMNVSSSIQLPTIMPSSIAGMIYYNSTFDCLAYYNSTDWKCSNGTVLVG